MVAAIKPAKGFAMNTLWIILYVVSHTPGVIGSYSNKADCEFVKRQMIEGIKPEKVACIEVPPQAPPPQAPPQMQRPAPAPQQ
jgi:hypothetical protein